MDKNFIEYCEIEGIDYKSLDNRQIKIIKKSFNYTGYELNKWGIETSRWVYIISNTENITYYL